MVISPFGLFVIETKNYKGWLFGDMVSPVWTQVLYGKQMRHYTFYNPVLQNQGHIIKLSKLLGISVNCMMSMLVFVNPLCNLNNVACNCCYTPESMYYTIINIRKQIFSIQETLMIAEKIRELNKSSYTTNKQHIKYVNKLKNRN